VARFDERHTSRAFDERAPAYIEEETRWGAQKQTHTWSRIRRFAESTSGTGYFWVSVERGEVGEESKTAQLRRRHSA
jgi:hypothetical protein